MVIPILLSAALTVSSIADLKAKASGNRIGTRFDLVARVLSSYTEINSCWTIDDNSGTIEIVNHTKNNPPPPGAIVKISGILQDDGFDNEYAVAVCQSFSILSEGPPPIPKKVTYADLLDGSCDRQLVSLRGTVQDVYQDEIDPLWFYIVLDCDGYLVNATFPSTTNLIKHLQLLADAQVEVTGIYSATSKSSKRRLAGPCIALKDVSAIRILSAAPEDPFNVPEVKASYRLGPMDISRMGRRRIRGTILAAWQGNRALVRTPAGRLSGIEFAQPVALSFGDVIDAVGFAETDLYRINLSRAIGRKIGTTTNALEVATGISANDIFTDERGNPRINPDFHGKSIQLTGLVKGLYDINGLRNGIILEDGNQTIAIDCNALPDLAAKTAAGCRIRISGTCILETDNWQPHAAFPKIKGVTLVPRVPTDLVVLSRPPWWTAGRLFAVIGILLVVIIGFSVWNRILNRLVERRSRQLVHERSKRDDANLKNEERMRLAVELHDTISQNLAGIALQVDSAQLAAESEPTSVPAFLESIRLRLLHCRKDLRNCLWDLRSRAFEEHSLADAIQMTLAPHLNGTEAEVVGDIPTRELSDNVIHSVLCIIRELSINAIRHGKAQHLHITCQLNGERLSLSVTDDGCGFVPEERPSISSGHFGIQGVIERIKRLEGIYEIDSSPGHGATFSIKDLKIGI